MPKKRSKGFETVFNFDHNEICGNVNQEIELFTFLCKLAEGIKFSIFYKNKFIYSTHLGYLEPFLEEWIYLLEYFKNLKKVEKYYNLSLSGLEINTFTDESNSQLIQTVSFIEDKFFEENWNNEININFIEISDKKLEELIETTKTDSVIFFHGKQQKEIILHDHILNIGYPSIYIVNPIIMNIDQFIINKKLPLIIKSKINKRRVKYNKFLNKELKCIN